MSAQTDGRTVVSALGSDRGPPGRGGPAPIAHGQEEESAVGPQGFQSLGPCRQLWQMRIFISLSLKTSGGFFKKNNSRKCWDWVVNNCLQGM